MEILAFSIFGLLLEKFQNKKKLRLPVELKKKKKRIPVKVTLPPYARVRAVRLYKNVPHERVPWRRGAVTSAHLAGSQ